MFKDIKGLLYPLLTIFLSGILCTILLHYLVVSVIGYNLFEEPDAVKKLDALTKLLTISIAITGFLSIIFTIIHSRKNIQREIKKNSVDLFQIFRSEKIRNARSLGWRVKQKWTNDTSYKQEFLKFLFNNPDSEPNADLLKETDAIYDLLEFYHLVGNYEGDCEHLKSYRYFYYGWWRRFLYEMAYQIESHRKVNPLVHVHCPDYLDNISYTKDLQQVDKLCGLENIPIHEDIHLNGG